MVQYHVDMTHFFLTVFVAIIIWHFHFFIYSLFWPCFSSGEAEGFEWLLMELLTLLYPQPKIFISLVAFQLFSSSSFPVLSQFATCFFVFLFPFDFYIYPSVLFFFLFVLEPSDKTCIPFVQFYWREMGMPACHKTRIRILCFFFLSI